MNNNIHIKCWDDELKLLPVKGWLVLSDDVLDSSSSTGAPETDGDSDSGRW